MFKLASESSIHGVNFIFGANRSKFVRVLWIFLVLTSLGGFSYYFKLAYTKWTLAPDITIKITEKSSKEFPMPAITICPMRFANVDQVDLIKLHELGFGKSSVNATQVECEYLYANLNWCAPPLIKGYMEIYCKNHNSHLEDLNIQDVVNRSAYKTEDLFSKKISNKFTRVMTFLGICFTYNLQDQSAIFNENIHDDFQCYKNQEHPEIEWNVERGYFSKNSTYPENASRKSLNFATMMKPKEAENFFLTKSLIVYLHLPSELPTEYQEGFLLNYGSQTMIDITAKSHRTNDNLRSYSPDIRKCYFEGEKKLEFFKTYTKSQCLIECRTNSLLEACNCVLFWMPRNKTTQVCRISNMECLNSSLSTMTENDQLTCHCLSPCNTIQYKFTSNLLGMDLNLFDIDRKNSITTIWTVGLSDSVEEIEDLLNYRLTNFVSDVGGLLGLFLGCSFLSIVEVFFFLLASLTRAINNQPKNKTQKIITTKDLLNMLVRLEKNILEHFTRNDEEIHQLLVKIDNLELNSLIVEDLEETLSEM